MADSVLEFLNANFASKKSGLVYEFFSYHTTKNTTSGTDALSVEVRRSVSMAVDLFAAPRLSANRTVLTKDSFASAPITDADMAQFRIGSHYLPNTPSAGIVELYAQYLYWMNKLRDEHTTGVKHANFVGSDGATINYGAGKYCSTLQRNAILDLSGIAINNSMTLAIEATMGSTTGRETSIFLRHLRRAVLFLESAVLET
jgi:hypothetical protein